VVQQRQAAETHLPSRCTKRHTETVDLGADAPMTRTVLTRPESAGRPRTTVTVRWLLTVCDATTRPGLPWVGLSTSRGPTPAAQGTAAAGSGRTAEGTTYPRGTPEPRSAITATYPALPLHAPAQASRSSLVPWQNLSGLQPLICSADAVARRLGRRPRCSRSEHGRLLPGWPSPLCRSRQQPGRETRQKG
jgi:hypothetical protein